MNKTDALAQWITKNSSLQTYYTIRLLANKDMANDAFKAYAYFRWLDDQIDIALNTPKKRSDLLKQQQKIIDDSYHHRQLQGLLPQEQMIYELILTDIKPHSQLKSYISKFFSVIAFDAKRRHQPVSTEEINWYSQTIGEAVTDCIQYFIGNKRQYPRSENQYKAATAAHIVHSLRDLRQDLADGYINVPKEYLKKYQINNLQYDAIKFSYWVKNRVELARRYFREGKIYIHNLPSFKCKLAARFYCLRFEPLLTIIERDNYVLRQKYTTLNLFK